MRIHYSRDAMLEGARNMLPVTIGMVPFGVVCGLAAVSAGASTVAAVAMSMIMFSGAAQIIAAQLIAAGAPLAIIILSCFVVSLRFLVYSAALAPYVRSLDRRWRELMAFLLTDQAFAASIARFRASGDLAANASYFVGGGVTLWAVWQLSSLVGIFIGAIIPAAWHLEFAVPLCFLALLAPLVRDRVTVIVVATTAIAAIVLDKMPLRLSMICAGLIGIASGVLAQKLLGREEDRPPEDAK